MVGMCRFLLLVYLQSIVLFIDHKKTTAFPHRFPINSQNPHTYDISPCYTDPIQIP